MSTAEEEETKTETAPAFGEEEAGDDVAVKEEESTATFAPLVQLEEVEVKSGEEEEEVLYTKRAKLFINGETLLNQGTGEKSWRERGIGEIRFLKHREHQRIRLLMRQEKTMKLIANHFVDPRIVLQPSVSSDRAWVWSAFDYSEEVLVETVFAARFKDTDISDEFKAKFTEYQKEMETLLKGGDAEDVGGIADEAAEALAGLSTLDPPTTEEKESKEE